MAYLFEQKGFCMKFNLELAIWLMCAVFISEAAALSAERERPKEWENLVYGGRFMDRFLPMPCQGNLTSDTWGAENVVPRYIDNGLEDNEWSYWGGNAKLAKDGRYHLYVCRWAENSPKGHMQWPWSEVVHAVSDDSLGSYRVLDTLGKGHNPEVFRLSDGRYVVYVMNGYYIADTVNGPWKYKKFQFEPRGRRIIEGLSNLTFAQREDGSYLMVCRGGGVWLSQTGISPYQQVTDKRVYPPVEGAFEDPVVWRTNVQYHLIVNDWYGRIAYYLRSKDGIDWKVEPGEAYLPGLARYEDGTVVDWYKYERIKVLQDEYGRATQAHFAVIDVPKKQDKANDKHSSKHICIPLAVGRLLTILDKQKITADTKSIRVKVSAEKDFNPYTDMDIESLRFGASEEVNFGRGARAIKTEPAGDDLIITFDATGHGITENNFAAKLLGKTTKGKLLFGYARLPWLSYIEPALSTIPPVFKKTENGYTIEVQVQNFGQVGSEITPIRIESGQDIIAAGKVPSLKPYQKTSIELTSDACFEAEKSYDIKVIIDSNGLRPITLQRSLIPASVK